MKGVTILNKWAVLKTNKLGNIVCAIGLSMVIIGVMVLSIWSKVFISMLLFLFGMIAVCSTIWFPKYFAEESGIYMYQCTLDDTASFFEITNNYEIVEINGNTIIMKDRCKNG